MKKHIKTLILSVILSHSWLFCAQNQISYEDAAEEFRQGKRTVEALGIISYCLHNPDQYIEETKTNTYSNPLASCDARIPWEIDDNDAFRTYLANPSELNRHGEWYWLLTSVGNTFQPIIELTGDINKLEQRLGSTTAVSKKLRITEEQLFGILNENATYTQVPAIGVAPTLQGTIDRYFDDTFTGIETFQNYYRQLFQGRENLLLMAALIEAEESDALAGINYPMSPQAEQRVFKTGIVTPALRFVIGCFLGNLDAYIEAMRKDNDSPAFGEGRTAWSIDEIPGVTAYLEEISTRDSQILVRLLSPSTKLLDIESDVRKLELKMQSLEKSPYEGVRNVYHACILAYDARKIETQVPNLEVNLKLSSIMERYGLGNLQETYNALYLEKAKLQYIVDGTKKAEQVFAQHPKTQRPVLVRRSVQVVQAY